jgi:hypothetical protein
MVQSPMLDKGEVRRYAAEWIEQLQRGNVFHLSDLYKYLKANFSDECDERGMTPDSKEPQYEKDARWAVQDCKFRMLITLAHPRGCWRRL